MSQSVPIVMLPPKAEAEYEEYKQMIYRSVKAEIIGEDRGWELIQAKLHALFGEARKPVDGTTNIGVRCGTEDLPGCGAVHIMQSDVTWYRCKCSPHTERPSFTGRVPLV